MRPTDPAPSAQGELKNVCFKFAKKIDFAGGREAQ
jgi:hypothetical protein